MVYLIYGAERRQAFNLASALLAREDDVKGKRLIPPGRQFYYDATAIHRVLHLYPKTVRKFIPRHASSHVA
jgi:hypothetical protein